MNLKIKMGVLTLIFTMGVMFSYLLMASNRTAEKEIVIKFKQDAPQEEVQALLAELNLEKIKSFQEIHAGVYRIDSQKTVSEVIQLCSRLPYVEYAEPTAKVRALSMKTTPTATVEGNPERALVQERAEMAEHKPGELLVKFKSTVSTQAVSQTLSHVGLTVIKTIEDLGIYHCNITSGKTIAQAIEECNADTNIEYAEPNYIYHTFVTPNDPRFPDMFGLDKIDAPEAWDKTTGSKSVIVGVIDTGTDHQHEDLKANIWINNGEFGNGRENNGIDDDGNGFVDDFQGWDFINNDNNPFDDNDHGTHVSGTIGAVGNNNIGVVGVNWTVSIMPLKFLGADGSGETADAVDAIVYATKMGAKVLSNSWGGGGFSRALEDAIKFANQHGVLFVAAAGNASSNNDSFPTYPANYQVDNVISVASTTRNDNLSGFSNWGKKTVHLAAPGSEILSTLARDRYGLLSGTSMATPHVSGAAALIWSRFPNLTMRQVKIRLLGSVDRLSKLADRLITGGRLNVNNALSTNPIIANTTDLDNTLDETGPYVVETDAVDDGSIASVNLTYQVVGQEAVTVSMAAQGNDHYRGEIPGQPLGSTIVYFVTAKDNEGNETRGPNFTFSIAEPTNGGGCCGRPAIEVAVGDDAWNPAVNAMVNISFFILPFVGFGVVSKRRKK
ncbi:MAG: hypothetical protein D6813_01445 [Calditrichaeota bacterium]|nr:MAG: hypothetical protein D6813_01445 [Calditrichota bacterium]